MGGGVRGAVLLVWLAGLRGEEVTVVVFVGAASVVWVVGGNRMHAARALLAELGA
jgi:ornithine carbamoyltransferase